MAAASASAATLLCASACANIWGFDNLQDSVGGGGGAGVIAPASGGGGAAEATLGGAPPTAADATAGGGQDGSDNSAGQGGSGTSDASGGATDATSGGMIDVAGTGGSSDGLGGPAESSSAGVGGAGDGAVAPGCGPSNCANGCCAGDRCITVTSAQQCGRGGGACSVCGGCQLCGPNGACTIDPASNWIVRCGSAELTVAPPTGATWDPDGNGGDGPEPDPFCQFELPSGIIDSNTGAATRTVNDSFAATWNQTITAGDSTITAADLMSASANNWRVWVGDSEFNGRAPLACEVHPPLQASALIDGQLTIMNVQNCVSLTLTLVCQP
jgi:hypothetical protein